MEETTDHRRDRMAATSPDAPSPRVATRWSTLRCVLQLASVRGAMQLWFFQDLCCTFMTTFFVYGVTTAHLSGWSASAALLSSFLLPQIAVVVALPLVRSRGLAPVVRSCLGYRIVLGGVILVMLTLTGHHRVSSSPPVDASAAQLASPQNTFVLPVLLFLAFRLLTECVCKLQGLALSVITDRVREEVDDDMRSHVPSFAAGLTSLGAKVAQACATPLGASLLYAKTPPSAGGVGGADPYRVVWVAAAFAFLTGTMSLPAWSACSGDRGHGRLKGAAIGGSVRLRKGAQGEVV